MPLNALRHRVSLGFAYLKKLILSCGKFGNEACLFSIYELVITWLGLMARALASILMSTGSIEMGQKELSKVGSLYFFGNHHNVGITHRIRKKT